jgi:hypothetical protein
MGRGVDVMAPDLPAAALDYAGRGWPVFPCEVGGKRPAGKLARHGLKDATIDPEVIRAWWSSEPSANIGLVTGVHFDVLDVDGEEGFRSLVHAIDEHGCLPSSPVSFTPNGGAHYFFKPTGLGNRAGFRPGLDWRGKGGYIVAPPSVGANGTPYAWVIPFEEVELDSVLAWPGRVNERKSGTVTDFGNPSRTGRPAYGKAALESELGRVLLAPEGCRNDALNRAAFSLFQLVATGQLDDDEVIQAVFTAGVRSGLGETECIATIRSARAGAAARPRQSAC